MADIIQANYESLTRVAKVFAQQASRINQMRTRLNRHMMLLRPTWVGKGSEAFFAEMSDKVLPAVQRLALALAEADRITRQIQEILYHAEEQGATPFHQEYGRGSADGANVAQGATSFHQDYGGETAAETGVSPDSASDGGAVDAFGGGFFDSNLDNTRGGVWDGEYFQLIDTESNLPDEIIARDGFGNTGDGFGNEGVTWPGGNFQESFLVPEDWLSQVRDTFVTPWTDGLYGENDLSESGAVNDSSSIGIDTDVGSSGAGGGSGDIAGTDQALGSGKAGGETSDGAGSAGEASTGSPLAAGSPVSGRTGELPGIEVPDGRQGEFDGGNGAGSLPPYLRYEPKPNTAGEMGASRTGALTAGSPASSGTSTDAQGGRANLGIPIGVAALGPLAALLGKAIRDRYAER